MGGLEARLWLLVLHELLRRSTTEGGAGSGASTRRSAEAATPHRRQRGSRQHGTV